LRVGPAAAALLLVLLAACSGMSPQPAEPARGRGNADIPDTALPSTRSSIFEQRERLPEQEFPPAPVDADLRPVTLRNLTDNKVELDGKALAVTPDAIVRYTLVVTSPQGARNVSYEGIRCDPAEWKTFALGRSDGTWATPSQSEWQAVEERGYNAIRFTLAKDYFCGLNGTPLKDANAIFARMRQQRALRDRRTD
jgi:hypothetical protein